MKRPYLIALALLLLAGIGILAWTVAGRQPKVSNEMPVHWVEFPHGFRIARGP